MQLLKQSTAVSTVVGPILDSTGAEYTGAVIGDMTITKNGTSAAMASAATLTHLANGHYTLAFTTGNTDTLGRLDIHCNKSTYQMPPKSFQVCQATVFDALVTNATTAAGGLGDIQRMAGTALTGRDIGASVLLSSGTGTGQLNFTSGVVQADAAKIGGQTASASGTVTFPNATLASTTNITAGTITTTTNLTNLPSITTDWITAAGVSAAAVTKIQSGLSTYAGGDTSGTTTLLGRVTSTRAGNLDYLDAAISSRSTYAGGAVASVTGAVGSVTGNVGGSVASVTAEVSANVTKINSVSTSSVSSIASHIGTTGASTAQTGDSYPIVSHVTYGLSAINTAISAIATKLGGITLLKNWLGALMGKTADSGTLAEITATTAGAGYNNTTDSLEALKDSQVDTDGLAGDVADAVVESLGDAAINVTVVSAFNQNGTRLRIRRGDDYASSNGRSLSFTITGLTAAVGTVAHLRLNGLEADAAVSPTITLATQTVTFGDVLAATTTQLTASKQPQPYTITFTIDGLTATMIEGWMYVSDPV